jgi:predicted RNA-binding protein YlqC (UPF0109 family)
LNDRTNRQSARLDRAYCEALVEDKAAVFLDEYEDGDETVIELEVAEAEVGKVIGRSGRIARALRTVLAAASAKNDRRYALEILE